MDTSDDIAGELARLRSLAEDLVRQIEALERRLKSPTHRSSAEPPALRPSTPRVPSLQMPAVRVPKRDDK